MNDFPDIFCYCEYVTTRNKTEKIKSDVKCIKCNKLLITNGQLERVERRKTPSSQITSSPERAETENFAESTFFHDIPKETDVDARLVTSSSPIPASKKGRCSSLSALSNHTSDGYLKPNKASSLDLTIQNCGPIYESISDSGECRVTKSPDKNKLSNASLHTPEFIKRYSYIFDTPVYGNTEQLDTENLEISGDYIFGENTILSINNTTLRTADLNNSGDHSELFLESDEEVNSEEEENIFQLEEDRVIMAAGTDLKTYTSLGRFLGENNEEVEKHFRKIERLHTKFEYTDQNKANMIPFGLEGKALDFYETLSEETKGNYNEAKEALIAHFKPNKSKCV